MIKMIVCDLDGTLLTKNKKVDDRTAEALKKASKQGIIIVIATGREKGSIDFVSEAIDLQEGNNYVAGNNGSIIYSFKSKEYVLDEMFDESDVHRVFGAAKKYGFEAIAVCGHNRYTFINRYAMFKKKIINFIFKRSNDYGLAKEGWDYIYVDTTTPNIPYDVAKFVFIQTPGYFKKYRGKIEEELHMYDLLCVGRMWYEMMPLGVNKGKAVEQIAKWEGIELDEILVFGDAENDVSMIEKVKYGIAMGNALPQVKKIAYEVCDTNNNYGIAKTIDKYVFRKEE